MKKSFSFASALFLCLLLSACGANGGQGISEKELLEKVLSEQNLVKDVSFTLDVLEQSAEEIKVNVVLQNPSLQKISSLRSWVSFPAAILEGTEIILPKDTGFDLVAPGEEEFDNVQGIAKIGVSLAADNAPQKTISVATLSFKRKDEATAALSFFDARSEGHTDALILYEGKARSVLKPSNPEPLLIN